jgi:uncharacterized protein
MAAKGAITGWRFLKGKYVNRLITAEKDSLCRLCRRYGVAQLEIFGSAARGESGPDSDLDFLVRFLPCTPEEHAERYLGLLADLQDLFHCDIDLVESNAISNPWFLDCIADTRMTLYAA